MGVGKEFRSKEVISSWSILDFEFNSYGYYLLLLYSLHSSFLGNIFQKNFLYLVRRLEFLQRWKIPWLERCLISRQYDRKSIAQSIKLATPLGVIEIVKLTNDFYFFYLNSLQMNVVYLPLFLSSFTYSTSILLTYVDLRYKFWTIL